MYLYPIIFDREFSDPLNHVVSSRDLLSIIYHWQTLAGAFLGTFFAIITSVLGYFAKTKWEDYKKWKVNLNTVEISTTMSLESVFTLRRQLRENVASIRRCVEDVKAVPNNKFAIYTVNLPISGKLFWDDRLPSLKVRSSYLHNKLIRVVLLLEDVDAIIEKVLRKDYDNLLQRHQFIINLEANKDVPNPANQRDAYAEDLMNFSNVLEIYSEQELPKLIKLLQQANLYGRLLNKDFKGTIRKFEFEKVQINPGASKIEHPLSFVDRIDSQLEPEIQADLKLIEERIAQTTAEQKKI